MDFVWKKRFRDYFGYGYGEKSVTDKLLKKVLQQRNKIFFNVFGLLREDHHENNLDHLVFNNIGPVLAEVFPVTGEFGLLSIYSIIYYFSR